MYVYGGFYTGFCIVHVHVAGYCKKITVIAYKVIHTNNNDCQRYNLRNKHYNYMYMYVYT